MTVRVPQAGGAVNSSNPGATQGVPWVLGRGLAAVGRAWEVVRGL